MKKIVVGVCLLALACTASSQLSTEARGQDPAPFIVAPPATPNEVPVVQGTIPGVSARTSGVLSFVLAIPAALTLFWWIAARSAHRLPVGPVGWVLGLVALISLTWCAVAAGALWSGRESEKERDVAESAVGSPIGLP